ncbi:alpha/beta hydrolase [Bacillus subtilis]
MSLNVTAHTYADGYRTNIFTVRATNAVADCFLFHGMLEHHERYHEFANHLAENGFNVYVCDLRGAGALAKEQESYAHLLPNEGFQQARRSPPHISTRVSAVRRSAGRSGTTSLLPGHLKSNRFPFLRVRTSDYSDRTVDARTGATDNRSLFDGWPHRWRTGRFDR